MLNKHTVFRAEILCLDYEDLKKDRDEVVEEHQSDPRPGASDLQADTTDRPATCRPPSSERRESKKHPLGVKIRPEMTERR